MYIGLELTHYNHHKEIEEMKTILEAQKSLKSISMANKVCKIKLKDCLITSLYFYLQSRLSSQILHS